MTGTINVTGELDPRFSSPVAKPSDWESARRILETAELFWLSTVRPDGRPHVTPLIAVWLDEAMHFTTGPDERKARNLDANPHSILTTGRNDMDDGLDVVLEGDAVIVRDEGELRKIADAYVAKYGEDWRFDVRDGAFTQPERDAAAVADVYRVVPSKVLGFAKGTQFGQTTWRFGTA
jgi:nitroimidazol reductase NimA-like FMN-containing flavoprotein (pyridoxamine 5'-phosphate oxidase superfamily)